MLKMSTIGRNACIQTLIALLIIVCSKSYKICCFYNVNKHAGYDMMSIVTSFAQ